MFKNFVGNCRSFWRSFDNMKFAWKGTFEAWMVKFGGEIGTLYQIFTPCTPLPKYKRAFTIYYWTQTCQVACQIVDQFIAFLFYRSSQKFEANTVWPTNLRCGQWGQPWVWKVQKGFVWRFQQQLNYWRRTTHPSWYATHKSCLFIFYSQITARAQKKRFAQLVTNVPLTSMGMEYPAGCISRTGRSSTSTRSMQSTSRRRRLMETRRVRTTRSRLWQSRKLCKIPILLFNYIYAFEP